MSFVHRSRATRRLLVAVPAVGLALSLSACGGSDGDAGSTRSGMPGMTSPAMTSSSSASTAGDHNDTDVVFATDMIPHHEQAVQMADVILAKTSNPEVKALAQRIKAAQSPEIATLSGWLKSWGQTPPSPSGHSAGMTGMDHSGMMSDQQMSQLSSATGTAADKLFLTLMQEHHQGAIGMAATELAQGTNPEAKKLAQSISTSQTAEIAQMKTLLAGLG